MTKLVGIVNLTPDSFSDGGKYDAPSAALAHVHRLIEQGADIIDIGAESTRPGATPLSAEEEWARLATLMIPIQGTSVPLSLDTRNPENARRALDCGFSWVNDVSGFADPVMRDTVWGYNCTCVAMHSLTVPADKNITLPEGADVVALLKKWALTLKDYGLKNLILDPGIGFGKTPAQSWQIIERIGELKALGLPLLVGHSRKSFLGEGDRDAATLAVSKKLIAAGVDYLRVHDVAAHRRLLEEAHG